MIENSLEIPFLELDSVIGSFENDHFFGPIVQSMNGKETEDPFKKNQVANLMPYSRAMEKGYSTKESYVSLEIRSHLFCKWPITVKLVVILDFQKHFLG